MNLFSDWSVFLGAAELDPMMVVMWILVGTIVLGVALGLTLVVFCGLGLNAIANRRGIANSWLAFVPLANNWIVGAISDQYQYVSKGKVTNRRFILLGVSGALGTVGWLQLLEIAPGSFDSTTALNTLQFLFFVTRFVLNILCMYDVYASCRPDRRVAYTVLGGLFFFLEPFFIFSCRKFDEGMCPEACVNPAAMPPENNTSGGCNNVR
jgi:hypothetical protein